MGWNNKSVCIDSAFLLELWFIHNSAPCQLGAATNSWADNFLFIQNLCSALPPVVHADYDDNEEDIDDDDDDDDDDDGDIKDNECTGLTVRHQSRPKGQYLQRDTLNNVNAIFERKKTLHNITLEKYYITLYYKNMT